MKLSSAMVLYSYHHNNTEKIAKSIAKVLDANIKKPQEINPGDLQKYDMIGFGSGIYDGCPAWNAAQALLNSEEIEVKKHSAVESSIGYYFAKSGRLDPKYHKMLINARKIREIADYDIQEEIVEP